MFHYFTSMRTEQVRKILLTLMTSILPGIVTPGLAFAAEENGLKARGHEVLPALVMGQDRVVFVDLLSVRSEFKFDFQHPEFAKVRSMIHYRMPEQGRAFFLFPAKAQDISMVLSGHNMGFDRFESGSPRVKGLSKNGYILQENRPGFFDLEIVYKLPLAGDTVTFSEHSGFDFFTRMTDRIDISQNRQEMFIEGVFPTNLQYNQYQFDAEFELEHAPTEYQVLANGQTQILAANHFKIHFLDHYTASSFFIHIYNPDQFEIHEFKIMHGNEEFLPVTIECQKTKNGCRDVEAVKERLPRLLLRYEEVFGSFPHTNMIVSLCDDRMSTCRGMEYSGAARTGLNALEHEFLHSWFGRSIYFRGGGDNWLQEAIVQWVMGAWPRHIQPRRACNVDVQALTDPDSYPYAPYTNQRAYDLGAVILEQLNRDLNLDHDLRGLIPVLRGLLQISTNRVVTQQDFFKFVLQSARTKSGRNRLRIDLEPWLQVNFHRGVVDLPICESVNAETDSY